MGLKYYKLWDLLNRRGLKKTDLYEILSTKTVAKLSKGEYVTTESIERICEFLHCQPRDIMEYIEPVIENSEPKEAVLDYDDNVTIVGVETYDRPIHPVL